MVVISNGLKQPVTDKALISNGLYKLVTDRFNLCNGLDLMFVTKKTVTRSPHSGFAEANPRVGLPRLSLTGAK
jgi:hypothetical protein